MLEGLLVAVAGGVLAFAANALSPRGLKLTTDYFRVKERAPVATTTQMPESVPGVGTLGHAGRDAGAPGNSRITAPVIATNSAPPPETNPALQTTNPLSPPVTNETVNAGLATNSAWSMLAARLRARGLHLADSNQVAQLFHDPRREQDLIVFIDARNEQDYEQGHVPGAYLLDYFHPEKHLAAVWPACQAAQQIVVYCNGGDCQDSELAAMMLSDNNVPKEKLFVYGGGIAEWATNGLPIEIGERRSGRLSKSEIRNPKSETNSNNER